MRKIFLLCVFLCTVIIYSFGQNNEIDSLKSVLETNKANTIRVHVLHELFDKFRFIDLDEAETYFLEAKTLALELEYSFGILENKYWEAAMIRSRGDLGKAVEKITEAQKYLKDNRPRMEVAESEEMDILLLDAKSAYLTNLGEKEEVVKVRYELVDLIKKTYEKGSEDYLHFAGTNYLGLGGVYTNFNDSLAIFYVKKARPLFKQSKDYGRVGYTFLVEFVCANNLEADLDGLSSTLDSSIHYFEIAGNNVFLQQAYVNKCAFLVDNDRALEAKSFCDSAAELHELTGNLDAKSYVLHNRGAIASDGNQFKKANKYYKGAYELSKELGTEAHTHELMILYAESFDSIGDYKNASYYKKIYIDSLVSYNEEELSTQFSEAEAKFQNTEKEKQIAQQALEIEKQKNNRNSALLGGVLALLAATGIYFWYYIAQNKKKRQTELALQKQTVEATKLRELDTLKSNFFANISHEFRTPLTLILGPLKEMIDGVFNGNRQTYYQMMHRNGNRLLQLINQLLDLSRLESGKMLLQASENDIIQYTKALAFSFESLAESKEIDFEVEVSDKEILTYFDTDKYEKIITNLLSNAFKFTDEKGKVVLSLTENEKQVKVQITDTGIGISAKDLTHIFDRFYQVDTSSTKEQAGSGIGLALTKELVSLHGGSLTVESEIDKGTTFTVRIPIGKNHLLPEQISVAAQSKPVVKKSTQKEADKVTVPIIKSKQPIVLIVEDNADVRLFVKDKIQEDYQVLEAENGKIGLEIANQYIPDLIISDVMMPEMDGFDFCKHIKIDEKTSHIPVVMLTAKADISDRIEGLETGADDYLTKPFNGEELLVRMKNLIEQRQSLRKKFSIGEMRLKEIAVTSMDEIFLTKLVEVIETNLEDERYGIEHLASDMHIGRRQLLRKIKALTNVTPTKLIRSLRLKRAKELLEKGAGNVSEVAIQTGFGSLSYFSKSFKEEFGMLPSEAGTK